jgi:hypothetical protein
MAVSTLPVRVGTGMRYLSRPTGAESTRIRKYGFPGRDNKTTYVDT